MRRFSFGDIYDARHRQYDAAARQFWSADPLGWVDAYDRWAYVGGDPVNRWDPFGLESTLAPTNTRQERRAERRRWRLQSRLS